MIPVLHNPAGRRRAAGRARPAPVGEPRRFARDIIRDFAEAHGRTYEEIVGPSKRHDLSHIRQRAMAEVKAVFPQMSLSRLGALFNRHWTTADYSLRAAAGLQED